jgi:hypothetical protein
MTPAQQITVDQLKSQGFELIVEGREIVRMTKGSDKRVICQNGSQKRGNHADMRKGIRA